MRKRIMGLVMKVRSLFVVLPLFLAFNAQAASFDCDKATTIVEKMICADAELSRLDEELAGIYAEALSKSSDPENSKANQKDWIKERNRCQDATCLFAVLQERIEQLRVPTAKPSEVEKTTRGKLRFQFCEDRPSLQCVYPGRGFSVCEAYLNHLNAMSEAWQQKHGACVPWIDPALGDFTVPDWQPLDIRDHLPWIYEIIRILPPSDKKLPPFEEWRGQYEGRIGRGEISPNLKKVRLKLTKSAGLETLLKYHEGDPVISGCKDGVPVGSGGSTREAIFLLRDEAGIPSIEEIFGFYFFADMLLFRGQPVFLYQDMGSRVGWHVAILVPDRGQLNPKGYSRYQRCEFIDTLYGRRISK